MDNPAQGQQELNQQVQQIWDSKAAFWDERMGDGNPFQRVLVGPASERLLDVQPGQVILDVACGNGVFSRRLAELGAQVVATDFSAVFLDRARARNTPYRDRIEYLQVDATDETALLALGVGRFDAVVCNMALMDIVQIDPLLRSIPLLLKPEGKFVFTLLHPCFNIAGATTLGVEESNSNGTLDVVYYIKVVDYLHVAMLKGAGMPDEPAPHYYFHRTLSALLGACFAAGLFLDGLEEPAFPADYPSQRPVSWLRFTHIPPVLAARLRPASSLRPAGQA
jgi:2-polyprenyl-3-methyl-5-hydroxy-6-metoxy-1,4-benzoquinol methylase